MIAGTLEIQLMANIARLASDMQKAQQTVDNTMSGIQSAVGFAQKALGALGIGLSINYFKNFVAGAIDAQDRLQDLSNRSGLSVTALAGLDHATKMTGTSLDVMVKGLKTVSTQLYEAQQGGKSAQDMFSGLGISVLDTNGALKSSNMVLVEVADKFATMTSETEKTALATKLFGKAGTDLIPMLNEGSDAIAAMVAEGQRLNPVTEESAKLAAAFNDNVDRLKTAVTGAGMSIVNDMLPGLVKFSDAVFEVTQNGKLAEWFDGIGAAANGTATIVSDFVEISYTGLHPFLSDISDLSKLAAEQISQFGSSVTSTGSTISTGIDQLDEIINSFFSNFSTGSVDVAEMFSLAFGTALPNTRAVIETATVAIADAVARMKIRITMDGAEQEAALSALDSIRNRSINEIIALRDQEMAGIFDLISAQAKERKAVESIIDTTKEFNDETYEAWLATQDMAEIVEVLGDRVAGTEDEIKAFNKSIDEYLKQQKKNQLANAETISELEMQQVALGMTARAQAVFNAVMKASSDGALPAQIAKIAELTAQNYDLSNSTKVTASTAEAAAKQSIESWNRTHEYLTNAFIDISNDGGSAFEKIADSAVQSVKRIIAEWLAMKAMVMLGIPTPAGSAGSAGGSAVGSILSSVGGPIMKSVIGGGASSAVPGGVAATMGGGGIMAGIGGAAGAAGSAISGAGSAMIAFAVANPVIAAALAAAALAATLSKEETPSGNAGFLIRDLAGGGDGRTFDVEPFASGFDPVGFARREDQGAAVGVIDTFRQYDAALTSIAKAAGIDVNYNSNTFGGFDEKGRGNGLFFGAANEDGRGSSVPIEQQLDQYVSQWIKGLGGQVDQSLINDVLAAGSADEMIKRAGMIAGIDGSHATGLAYVPFDGYVAELHRGERVVPASENVGDGTMSAMVAELRAMRAELIDIRKNSMDSYNLLDKWDNDPLTVQVAA